MSSQVAHASSSLFPAPSSCFSTGPSSSLKVVPWFYVAAIKRARFTQSCWLSEPSASQVLGPISTKLEKRVKISKVVRGFVTLSLRERPKVLTHISKEMLPREDISIFWNHYQVNQCVHGRTTSTSAPGDAAAGPTGRRYNREQGWEGLGEVE